MNENQPPLEIHPDEHLEARITAYVLGEASPFEAAEIEALIDKSPELKLFATRTRTLNDLLKEAETTSNSPDSEWKLSAEKRAALAPHLGPAPVLAPQRGDRENRIRRASFRSAIGIAAVFLVTLFTKRFFVFSDERTLESATITNYSASEKTANKEARLDALRRAVRDQENKVEEARKILTTISRTKNLIYNGDKSLSGQGGLDEDQTANFSLNRHTELESEKMQLESQIQSLLKYDSDQLSIYASGLDLPENTVKTLYPQKLELKRQIDGLKASGLGDDHPTIKSNRKVLEAINGQLEESTVNLRTRLQGQLEMTKERLAKVELKKDETKQDALERSIDTQDYVDAKRDFETDQAILDQMKLKLMSAEVDENISEDSIVVHEMRLESDSAFKRASKKPQAPSAAKAEAIASTAPSPNHVPIPDLAVAEPSADLGDGDDFGGGWGGGGASRERNTELGLKEATPEDQPDQIAKAEIAGPAVHIDGQVRKPGQQEFKEGLTLWDAVQRAGGATEFGSTKRVKIHRNGETGTYDLTDKRSFQVELEPGDTIEMPQKNWLSTDGSSNEVTKPLAEGEKSAVAKAKTQSVPEPEIAIIDRLPPIVAASGNFRQDSRGLSTGDSPTNRESLETLQLAEEQLRSASEMPIERVEQERLEKALPEVTEEIRFNDKDGDFKDSVGTNPASSLQNAAKIDEARKQEVTSENKKLDTDSPNDSAAAPGTLSLNGIMDEASLRKINEKLKARKPGRDRYAMDTQQLADEENNFNSPFGAEPTNADSPASMDPFAETQDQTNSSFARSNETDDEFRSDLQPQSGLAQNAKSGNQTFSWFYENSVPNSSSGGFAGKGQAGESGDLYFHGGNPGITNGPTAFPVTPATPTGPSVTARSGQAANIDVSGEFIYPTEYEAAELREGRLSGDGLAQDYFDTSGLLSDGKNASGSTEYKLDTGDISGYNFRGTDLSKAKESNDAGVETDPEGDELAETDVPQLGDIPVVGRMFKKPAIDLADLSQEILANQEPFSTFSLNISDASFQIASASVEKGERPDPDSIKPEQFYNAVDYGDPAPSSLEPVAAAIDQTAHPVIPGRNLVRVGIRTASTGRSAAQPLRLTLLVDQSGSMVRNDRRAAMDKALEQLAALLTENDEITVIGFSRTPRLLADSMKGDKAGKLSEIINQTANEGGTNIEQAINLASDLALRHKLDGAQNRIVLFTDGAANLGNADPERLADKVKDLRQQGLAFDIAGIGTNDTNDQLLSELARHGNGRYYLVGENTGASLATQLAGAFRPAAENVKVQVKLNPQRVGSYKLIGFEKDRLKTEDFRNDSVDAAELAADEAGVAMYQVETLPEGSGEIGEVSVRFRDTASGEMVERTWTIPYDTTTPAFDKAAPKTQLATLSLLAAQKLQGGPLADAIGFGNYAKTIAELRQTYKADAKAQQMLNLINALK